MFKKTFCKELFYKDSVHFQDLQSVPSKTVQTHLSNHCLSCIKNLLYLSPKYLNLIGTRYIHISNKLRMIWRMLFPRLNEQTAVQTHLFYLVLHQLVHSLLEVFGMANFRSIWFSMAQKQYGFGAKSKQKKKT